MYFKKIAIYVSVLLAVIFWGTSFVWSKKILIYYQPFTLIFLRLVLSSILLCVISLIFKLFKKPSLKDFFLFLLVAVFQPFLYFIGEGYGLKYTSSSFTSVIIATIPLFVPFAALIFLKNRIKPVVITGIILSFIGVYVMMSVNSFETFSWKGISFLMLAVFSAVGYSIVVKMLTEKFNPVTIILYQNIIGVILFLPFFLYKEMDEFIAVGIKTEIIYDLLKLAILSSTIAFVCFTYSISKLGVNKTSVFSNFIPVVTAIFAYYTINEAITYQKVIGILLVIAGISISQISFRKKHV